MTVPWPAAVPQTPLAGSFSSEPQRNVISFAPEYGPPIERRATSMMMEAHSYRARLTAAEYATLMDFYRDDLQDGVLAFARDHPRTGEPIVARFSAAPADADDIPGHVMTTISYLRIR
ncbi:MAG TPA: hypothetical protein VIH40_09375 [Xanthobacteraceae bacterium]